MPQRSASPISRKPDYGDPVPIADDETAGVLGLRRDAAGGDRAAKMPFAITHSPG